MIEGRTDTVGRVVNPKTTYAWKHQEEGYEREGRKMVRVAAAPIRSIPFFYSE